MICVLTLFGETDLQPILKKAFGHNDIFFLEENCITSVQLTEQTEIHKKEIDVVIIYANAMNMEVISDYVTELRGFSPHLRVILVLSGNPNQYLRSQINDYRSLKLDLIFDDDGFDLETLMSVVKKGKLSNKDFKPIKRESGFVGDIEEGRPVIEKTKNGLEDKAAKKKKEKFTEKIPESENDSFSVPQGHFTIGVMNAARGAGATWTVNNLARYFSMQNYNTCIADMSGTKAVAMMKLKNIKCFTENIELNNLKEEHNITVIDFGTPIEINPNGENFKLNNIYGPKTIGAFTECDIKIIMGFSDAWNIEKINFFFINDTWREKFDSSYIFVVPSNAEKVKKLFPEGNIVCRNDDYREMILDVFRREELH